MYLLVSQVEPVPQQGYDDEQQDQPHVVALLRFDFSHATKRVNEPAPEFDQPHVETSFVDVHA